MKTVRRLTTMLGLTLVLIALGAISARGQFLDSTQFVGTFTLPISAQWGTTTLPAGNYTLRYGTIHAAGGFVEVRGTEKGSRHVVIRVEGVGQSSATKTALVCIRDGAALFIRSLEMPGIGETATFALPQGARLAAHLRNGGTNTQLVEAPILIQRVPVTLVGK